VRKVFGPPKGGWPTDVIVPFEQAKLVVAALRGQRLIMEPPKLLFKFGFTGYKEIVKWSDYGEFDYIIPLARDSVEGSK
jgi:hypothetical protein